jgi:uncharacterized protein involved in exopolysaccharide biosynthesis
MAVKPYHREEEDVRLEDFVTVLVRRRWLVVAGAFVTALVALVATYFSPRLYESSVTVRVADPAAVAPFQAILQRRQVSSDIVGELGLDRPPHNLTPGSFVERALRIETIPSTTLVRARVSLPEPEAAARAAEMLAARAIAFTSEIGRKEAAETLEGLKRQLDVAARREESLRRQLLKFKGDAMIELQQARMQQTIDRRARIDALAVSIEAERMRLATTEQGLSGHRPTVKLQNSEVLDPVYDQLKQRATAERATIAALETERALLEKALTKGTQERQLSRLYESQNTLARLQGEYDVALASYTEASSKYANAHERADGLAANLRVTDAPVVSGEPVSPRRLQTVLIAFVFGFLFSAVGILVFDSITQP